METMEANYKTVSYVASDIQQETVKGVVKIAKYAMENNYRLMVEKEEKKIDIAELCFIYGSKLEAAILISSKRTKKRLINRLRGLEKGISLKKMNTLLHFLKTKVLKDTFIPTHRFITSEREFQIQTARVNWITLRDAAEIARKQYKELKGDFYKNK